MRRDVGKGKGRRGSRKVDGWEGPRSVTKRVVAKSKRRTEEEEGKEERGRKEREWRGETRRGTRRTINFSYAFS